jgi:phosphoenolpyruvate carboxylase
MQTSPAIETEDKDLPLREDIRLLGRILGDTIREQSGGAVFDTVENIRQNSVRFRRDEDLTARRDILAPFEAAERRAISDSQRMLAFGTRAWRPAGVTRSRNICAR